MAAPPRALVLAVCAVLLAIAVANAEAASVVVGLAKCGSCARKNMKAEEAFKGLQVAIKCKNVQGDYESKAVGGLDSTGAFSVPLAADLQGADCVAQLHSAATNAPCTGQEPSRVVPVSGGTTYGVVAGAKTTTESPECASVTVCGPIKKHILEHFHHKKPVPPKPEPKPQPHPDYHPVPPTPTYGGRGGHPSTPIYHAEPSETALGPIKKHILDHFHHKKPVPPKPEPKPQPHPDYHPVPPTPTYGGGGGHPSTPIYHAEPSETALGPIKKHILDHFHHKKPVPPKPEHKPQPHPDYHPVPPTPTYGGGGGHPSTPIYHAEPSETALGPIKKHILDHFHHKKPVPPKPEPKPQPHPYYHHVPPTPTYGGGGGHPSTPIYHAEPSETMLGPIKKHILDHFHHKKPVPPKPEPKPQPHPYYHPVPPTPTYGGGGGHPSTPIYHAEPSKTALGPIKKHILDHFHHKKPMPPKPEPKPQPHPDYHPVPPTPTYGGGGGHPSTPIYHAEPSETALGPIKKHILDHFHHKKPVPPKPEPKPQPHPDYHPVPPTPTYGGGGGHPSTPIYHAEPSETALGPIKKHILDHFHHKKPMPPKPEPKPQPHPDYHPVPPTPTYGGGGGHPSTPIYHAEPSETALGPIKKHILDHFHHKKPVPPKPEPKPQPHPDYHPVPTTPTYGGGGGHPSTPIYHAEASETALSPIKKHILDHFHHKKSVPPKPEPKPQPHPDYHPVPPTPTYGGGHP